MVAPRYVEWSNTLKNGSEVTSYSLVYLFEGFRRYWQLSEEVGTGY
jgi:hypothetical protein